MTTSSYDTLPNDAFVRMRDLTQLTSLCRNAIYNEINAGRFPRQHRLTRQAAGWRMGDVRAWLRDPAGWRAQEAA